MVYANLYFDQTKNIIYFKKYERFDYFLTRFDTTLGVALANCFVFKGVRPTIVPVDVPCAA
jgi:hypothetical protein